ncbi:low molecular weight protein-tyrosine-phosphatase [Pseudomonas oryzihabitans]|uniref:low molecular weight protein-tyrosine-phosphatase n=1 Tax=Pseudomonas oryzihabitans TaxID=47885 RepID=UPI0015E42DEC|nr:low molecular weight protein-tyrosine-phosphatase [Pseudomonas psychrotolerans]MBA1213263.1 low molecular weight phosphotyrosine protein phosphatase [Pseudomonas psychrotolerans]
MTLRILFVCMGNICRSPTAEGILRAKLDAAGLAEAVELDSAGTGDWHVGKAPDARAIQAAAGRGYDIGDLRARQVTADDFQRFDLILAMDQDNLAWLKQLRPGTGAVPELFLARQGLAVDEVPDPYYGGAAGFARVLDLLESACDGLVAEVAARHGR